MNSDQAKKIYCKGCVNRVETAGPPSIPDWPVSAARRNNTLHGPCHKKDCTDKIDTVYSNRGTDGVRTHDLSRVRRTLIPAELPFRIHMIKGMKKGNLSIPFFRAEDGT